MSRWYRAYEGTVTDAKLGEAALVAGVSRSVSIAAWHCILESAASKNNCGSYEVTPRRAAVILCEPVASIEALFAAFEELGLSEAQAVCAWKKRQFQSDDSKERVRHHRAKKAGNSNVTACNGDVTPPETETETDKIVSNETNADEPKVSIIQIQEAWNAIPAARGAIECKRIGPERRRKANTFLARYSVEDITEAIHAVGRSDFLCGRGDNNFRADIEFLFSPKHMNRLLEGFYDR